MPASLQITLTKEEDRTLEELSCASAIPRRTKQRAVALRLNAYGWSVSQIAQYLHWAPQTVRETIHRWQQQGLGGLWEAAGRGGKRRWSEADWQVLGQWLAEPRHYSARQLSQKLASERGVILGAKQVRRLLKRRLSMETYPL